MARNSLSTLESYREPLTEREREILLCLAEGLTNQQVAIRLNLAKATIRWYNTQIFQKLGVSDRHRAVEVARAYGLLDEHDLTRPVKHNLPAQTTPFIGRRQEVSDVVSFLKRPDIRLMTLCAAGGMGKTRIALEVARQLLNRFADGVFFVPLAPLVSSVDLITTIAECIGFEFSGNDEPLRQLCNYLRGRSALLVLDNFEHLLDGTGYISDILLAAPCTQILVTSREKLNLSGETVFRFEGMPYPETNNELLAGEYDTFRLFWETAKRIRTDFTLQDDDLIHLARICRLTAGMPLAIILAASWVDILSVNEIADEISQGLDWLQSEHHDMPDRHRSIQAVFAPTWSRLTDELQRVFARLAVFRGGFTRDAAQAVAGASLSILHSLANKALIYTEAMGRYNLHELLRQYAEEKLRAVPGEYDKILALHRDYYIDFLYQRRNDPRGPRQVLFLEEIGADIKNIRFAWDMAVAEGAYTLVGKGMEAMARFYHEQSWFVQGVELFTAAAHSLEAEPPEGEQGVVYGRILGRLADFFLEAYDQVDEAQHCANESLRVLRQLDADAEMFSAWHALGMASFVVATTADQAMTAKQYLQKAYDTAEMAGDLWKMALALSNIGRIPMHLGSMEEAQRYMHQSLTIFSSFDDSWTTAWSLFLLAWLNLLKGVYDKAWQYAEQGLQMALAGKSRQQERILLWLLGRIACHRGLLDAAQHHLSASSALFQEAGVTDLALAKLGMVARLNGCYAEAEQYFQELLQAAPSRPGSRFALQGLGQVALDRGDCETAFQHFAACVDDFRNIKTQWDYVYTVNGLAEAADTIHHPEALSYICEALLASISASSPPLMLYTLVRIAGYLSRREQSEQGVELLALCQQHTASSYEARIQAANLLEKLQARLPAETFQAAL